MTLPPTGSLQKRELLLFEISSPGTVGMSLPGTEVPDAGNAGIEEHLLRKEIVDFPELSEVDVVRHFTRLSRWNYAIDLGLFPLGSCTMKYNPRFNENAARLPGLAMSHPAAASGDCQGSLALMFELEQMLCSITGMAAVTLQPPAGAAGELTGVMMMRALLQERGDPRVVILIPDSAHGTNPASARLSGYQVETIISNAEGRMDLDALQARMLNLVSNEEGRMLWLELLKAIDTALPGDYQKEKVKAIENRELLYIESIDCQRFDDLSVWYAGVEER